MLNSAELAQLSWVWKKFQNFVSIFKIYKAKQISCSAELSMKKVLLPQGQISLLLVLCG